MSSPIITDLRSAKARRLRNKAQRHFAEADELRRHANEHDLAGLDAEQQAYEIETT